MLLIINVLQTCNGVWVSIALHPLSNQFTKKAKQMTAQLIKAQDAINAKAHRKENHFSTEWTALVIKDGKMLQPVTLRTYNTQSGGSNSACIWVSAPNVSCSGSGRATGYGYHIPSAAVAYAIESAGFKLSQAIDGRGDEAIEEAVRAIGVCVGFNESEIFIHRANA